MTADQNNIDLDRMLFDSMHLDISRILARVKRKSLYCDVILSEYVRSQRN